MKNLWSFFLLIFAFYLVQIEVSGQIENRIKDELIETQIVNKPSPKLIIPKQPAIENFITYYQGGGRISMESGLANSTLYQKMIRRFFREEGVPESLSAINQTLWMGASDSEGLWLFSNKTAKKYSLRKTDLLDETKSFEKATRVTAQHLKSLYNKYENWELALAAYYSDESKIDSAIKRAKKKNFWKITKYLPENTRNFVPNVLATVLIAENPSKYGFEDIDFLLPIEYELVRIAPSIKLEIIAEYSESPLEIIKSLNPELLANSTPPMTYLVRVPKGKGKIFASRIRNYSANK